MAVFQSFVLPTKSVCLCWADNSNYWKCLLCITHGATQKAEVLEVCRLQIRGTFDTAPLDKDTTWSIVCLLKHNDSATALHTPAEVSVSQKDGTTICSRKVHLNSGSADLIQQEGEEWLALEVRRFQPAGVSREITFNLLDRTTHWKTGSCLLGWRFVLSPLNLSMDL